MGTLLTRGVKWDKVIKNRDYKKRLPMKYWPLFCIYMTGGKSMKKLLTAVLACTLLLSGCGSSAPERAVSQTTGKTYFKVGMDCDDAPFNSQTKQQTSSSVIISDDSYSVGYDVNIARKLAETMGEEIQVKKISRDTLKDYLDKYDIDVIISALSPSEALKKEMDFTKPYYSSERVLVVRKDDKAAKYKDIAQFKGLKVAALANSSFDDAINEIKEVKHADALKNTTELVKALTDKKVDAIVVGKESAQSIVKKNKDLVVVTPDEKKGFSTKADYVIGVKKGTTDEDFFENLQKALDGISKEDKETFMKAAIA